MQISEIWTTINMNTRNLVTSLSQQLDTSCTDFPDGFEETQANQLQVSVIFVVFLSSDVHYFLKGLKRLLDYELIMKSSYIDRKFSQDMHTMDRFFFICYRQFALTSVKLNCSFLESSHCSSKTLFILSAWMRLKQTTILSINITNR